MLIIYEIAVKYLARRNVYGKNDYEEIANDMRRGTFFFFYVKSRVPVKPGNLRCFIHKGSSRPRLRSVCACVRSQVQTGGTRRPECNSNKKQSRIQLQGRAHTRPARRFAVSSASKVTNEKTRLPNSPSDTSNRSVRTQTRNQFTFYNLLAYKLHIVISVSRVIPFLALTCIKNRCNNNDKRYNYGTQVAFCGCNNKIITKFLFQQKIKTVI